MNPDKPFVLRGGNTEQAAVYNRIAVLERVKYLTGVDLAERSVWYRYALDLEMYQRWYKNEPKDKQIDEEFCQRMAIVVRDMEKDADMYDKATELGGRVASAYRYYKIVPDSKTSSSASSKTIYIKPKSKIRKIIDKLKGGQ
jgi:hypothetical protein